MEQKPILLRLREKDTGSGVTRATLQQLAKTLGVSETDAIHKALADSARMYLPQYEADDGPLTAAQHRAIAKAVKKSHGGARVVESLFGNDTTREPGVEHKTVRSPSRAR